MGRRLAPITLLAVAGMAQERALPPPVMTNVLAQAHQHWLGQGEVKRDRIRAAGLYLQAAEAGDAEAMAHLGRMHFRGEGIPKDSALAMKWLKASAEKGNARGLYHLAELYQNGVGVPVNHAEYARLLTMDLRMPWRSWASATSTARGSAGIPPRREAGTRRPRSNPDRTSTP